jgi:iron(III)-enterobactin esterase
MLDRDALGDATQQRRGGRIAASTASLGKMHHDLEVNMKPKASKTMRIAALALLLCLAAGGSGMAESGEGDGRFVISPPYTPAPEVVPNYEIPQGTLHEFTMNSADSAIFPKDVATGEAFARSVSVYVPAQYEAGTEAPFMVVQDGVTYFQGSMVPVLDNMIHAGTLPVMIVIFVEPGPNSGADEGQRSYEYDSLSEDYVTFVETELLPRVEKDYGVKLTEDPDGRAAAGGSSGGAAAFTMGWFRPDKYRRILTWSGSFVNLQTSATYPNGASEYHEHLIASSPAKPLRVALSVGERDADMNYEAEHRRNWVAANEAMAKALAAKGYHYRYLYEEGAEHVDFGPLEQTLPETLRWLWQGYPGQSQ